MKRSYTKPFGELLSAYLDAIDIYHHRREVKMIDSWPEVVGLAVAKRTEKMYVKNRVLFVHMNSSVARNELTMIREGLLGALNKRAGYKVIDDLVIR